MMNLRDAPLGQALASVVTLKALKRADLATLMPTLGTPLKSTRTYNSVGLLERETAVDGTVASTFAELMTAI